MRGKPFERGNKAGKGRPSGSRNQKSIFEENLAEFGVPIIKKGALMALNGDPTLLRVCFERLISPAQPSPTRFRFPKADGEPDMEKVLISVLKQTSTGRVSPQAAELIGRFVESLLRAKAALEHEGRLEALENDNDDSVEEAA
jgi:hypothetical protein